MAKSCVNILKSGRKSQSLDLWKCSTIIKSVGRSKKFSLDFDKVIGDLEKFWFDRKKCATEKKKLWSKSGGPNLKKFSKAEKFDFDIDLGRK